MNWKFFFYTDPRSVIGSIAVGGSAFEMETCGTCISEVREKLRRYFEDCSLTSEGIQEALKTIRPWTKRFPRQRRVSKRLSKKLCKKSLFKEDSYWASLEIPKSKK